jgi:hypothetical protein
MPVVTLHAGVAPEQVVTFVDEHSPHAPFGWQAGVTPPHWLSAVQPRQPWVVESQNGVAPPQSPLVRHPMHTPIVMSQRGVAPVHWLRLLAEHCVHAPVAKQAGVAPTHWVSLVQT